MARVNASFISHLSGQNHTPFAVTMGPFVFNQR